MSWDHGITGATLNIAQCTDNPLRVMAGPGTGKSFAMQRRVARLLEQENIAPGRILAVTFTRNAAANLVKDLISVGVSGCENIRSGTLHAFCFYLLAKQSVLAYVDRIARTLITFNKSGVAQFEYQPMLHDIDAQRNFGGKRKCTKRIRAFEAAWARLQHENPGWPIDIVDRRFQNELLDWLKFHKGLLIGELVPEALKYIRNNPGCPELSAFDHIIVDEYQDLNKAEQILLDILSNNSNLSIVGDIDQSIYAFRFANPTGIIDFLTRHPGMHDEPLQECRRCPKKVVVLADSLIRSNYPSLEGIRLTPKADNPDGEVHIVQWESVEQEAQGLAVYIQHLVNNRGFDPSDILVLSPRRILGYAIRNALKDLNINAHSFYHEEMLETLEAQKAFTLLSLLADPDDRVSLRFWLGLDSPSWNTSEYNKLRLHCESFGQSPREALDDIVAGRLSINRIIRIKRKYQELLSSIATMESLNLEELVNNLFPADIEWAKPLRETALFVINRVDTPPKLLNELRLQITQPEMPENGDFVRVMSLHKAKGLTNKVTIVAGCIEGLIPTVDPSQAPSVARANLEEQRRLFYVSMTRCKEILMLSSVQQLPIKLAYRIGARVRGRQGVCSTIASRFFSELGPTSPTPIYGQDWISQGFVSR